MDEMERLERIDRLAARMLMRESEERPATEVWDDAEERVNANIAREIAARIEAE